MVLVRAVSVSRRTSNLHRKTQPRTTAYRNKRKLTSSKALACKTNKRNKSEKWFKQEIPTARQVQVHSKELASAVVATGKLEFKTYDDWTVALGVSKLVNQPVAAVYTIMKYWEKPILKAAVPGVGGRIPDMAMLNAAKSAVIRFLEAEEEKQAESHLVQAFHLVTGETRLHFAWEDAKRRIRRAKLDCDRKIDSWERCLAMQSGPTNASSEIYVCGTRRITLRAMTSLICHEGLHNLARRTRPGNPYLSEELEHLAMALLGDPQLSE